MSGLSLWLSPSNGSPLNSFLARLSSTLQSPAFQAHATLVSDEIVPAGLEADEVVKRVKEGVQQWQAAVELTELQLSFKDVRQGQSYYQCVLAAVVDNPSLLTLHNALLEAFDLPVPAEPTYFPHLSLVYGDLSSEEKDRIIADLKLAGDVEDLKGSEGETRCKLVGETGYVPTEVLLVRTGGKPEEWEILARIPLGADGEQ